MSIILRNKPLNLKKSLPQVKDLKNLQFDNNEKVKIKLENKRGKILFGSYQRLESLLKRQQGKVSSKK